jgi:hypothetical protein
MPIADFHFAEPNYMRHAWVETFESKVHYARIKTYFGLLKLFQPSQGLNTGFEPEFESRPWEG